MKRSRLSAHLRSEADQWAKKPFEALVEELRDVVAYEVGASADWYQCEVQILEHTDSYVHVGVAVDDGGWRAIVPLSMSFLVYRDGRVDK